MSSIYGLIAFLIACYAVMGNDAIQTLGTFMASQGRIFKWYWLWLGACAVMTVSVTHIWMEYNGDLSYGRLDTITKTPIQWYHLLPLFLLAGLTWRGIPVSTTFLTLFLFSDTLILNKILLKSAAGFGIAAIFAYFLWFIIARFINKTKEQNEENLPRYWYVLQWIATGFLFHTWLEHDMANIVVYMPKETSPTMLIFILIALCAALAIIFRTQGGRMQEIVDDKTGTKYIRAATLINIFYALLLFNLEEISNIPVSTTWVFIGLLSGREIGIATALSDEYSPKKAFPIIRRDFFKIMSGLVISLIFVVSTHYILSNFGLLK